MKSARSFPDFVFCIASIPATNNALNNLLFPGPIVVSRHISAMTAHGPGLTGRRPLSTSRPATNSQAPRLIGLAT